MISLCKKYLFYRRNANYRDIIKGLSLGQKHLDLFDVTNQFHHVFWFGDLNYRVEDNIEVSLQSHSQYMFYTFSLTFCCNLEHFVGTTAFI